MRSRIVLIVTLLLASLPAAVLAQPAPMPDPCAIAPNLPFCKW